MPQVFAYSQFGPGGEQHRLVSGPGKQRHNMTYLNDESSRARQSRGQGQEMSKGKKNKFLYLMGPIPSVSQFQ